MRSPPPCHLLRSPADLFFEPHLHADSRAVDPPSANDLVYDRPLDEAPKTGRSFRALYWIGMIGSAIAPNGEALNGFVNQPAPNIWYWYFTASGTYLTPYDMTAIQPNDQRDDGEARRGGLFLLSGFVLFLFFKITSLYFTEPHIHPIFPTLGCFILINSAPIAVERGPDSAAQLSVTAIISFLIGVLWIAPASPEEAPLSSTMASILASVGHIILVVAILAVTFAVYIGIFVKWTCLSLESTHAEVDRAVQFGWMYSVYKFWVDSAVAVLSGICLVSLAVHNFGNRSRISFGWHPVSTEGIEDIEAPAQATHEIKETYSSPAPSSSRDPPNAMQD